MARIEWSPRAREDLRQICDFIARDSEYYARSFVRRAVETFERCGEFPEAGSIVPEFDDPKLRERLVYRYRLIYRSVSESHVEVVAIIHGTRLMPADVRGGSPENDINE
jgi:toxin ParE1/3/4